MRATIKDSEHIFEASLEEDWDIDIDPPVVKSTDETEVGESSKEGVMGGPQEKDRTSGAGADVVPGEG